MDCRIMVYLPFKNHHFNIPPLQYSIIVVRTQTSQKDPHFKKSCRTTEILYYAKDWYTT